MEIYPPYYTTSFHIIFNYLSQITSPTPGIEPGTTAWESGHEPTKLLSHSWKKVWILTQFNLHAVLHLKIYHLANLSPCQKITIIKLSILPIIVANRMVSLFSRDRVCFNVDSTAFPFHSYINFSVFHRAVINCTLHFSLPAFTKALKYL